MVTTPRLHVPKLFISEEEINTRLIAGNGPLAQTGFVCNLDTVPQVGDIMQFQVVFSAVQYRVLAVQDDVYQPTGRPLALVHLEFIQYL